MPTQISQFLLCAPSSCLFPWIIQYLLLGLTGWVFLLPFFTSIRWIIQKWYKMGLCVIADWILLCVQSSSTAFNNTWITFALRYTVLEARASVSSFVSSTIWLIIEEYGKLRKIVLMGVCDGIKWGGGMMKLLIWWLYT